MTVAVINKHCYIYLDDYGLTADYDLKAQKPKHSHVAEDVDHHTRLDVSAYSQIVVHGEEYGGNGTAYSIGSYVSDRGIKEEVIGSHKP